MGKTAFITGGSRGVGFSIAEYFASKNMNLILLSKSNKNLKHAKKEILSSYPGCNIDTYSVDMTNPDDVNKKVKEISARHASIDILVSSAGILTPGCSILEETSLTDLFSINIISTIVIINEIARKMKSAGTGHIFNISSLAGSQNKSKIGAYAASKSAITSYSESLYKELIPFGISVSCLAPSVINTKMTDDGIINNEEKIQTIDIVNTIDYIMALGETAMIPYMEIYCKTVSMRDFA
jgi:short-subunit dehydrogenase